MFCRNAAAGSALRANLDEMRAFQRAFREQDAVVGDDADQHAGKPREAGDQRRSIARLEFVEGRTVDKPRNEFSRASYCFAQIDGDDALELFGGIERLDLARSARHARPSHAG